MQVYLTYQKSSHREFPLWLGELRTCLVSVRISVQSLASLSRLRILHCCKLQHRLQMKLRSGLAVAAYSTPSLGTSICHKDGPKKKKKKRKKEKLTLGEPYMCSWSLRY